MDDEIYQLGCELLELIDGEHFNKLSEPSKKIAVCFCLIQLVDRFYKCYLEEVKK